ncbi:MAG: hypothetical protein QOK33_204 [Mycobacterium sp.]|jgi:hypothetical protein|nr:hypothetical protein [Mycobacterium sp.]
MVAELAALPGVRVASQPGSKALLDEDHPASLDRLILRRVSVQVLVTTGREAVHRYDSVISDPARSRAKRYGLKRGGRVVIRPDGYIGAISATSRN